jgi:hypothetical protein
MWPDDYWEWRGVAFCRALYLNTFNELWKYRILRDDAGRIALEAAEAALARAESYLALPGFFASEGSFQRWASRTAHREASRRSFSLPRLRDMVGELSAMERQVLYWYYVDGLPFRQVALILWDDLWEQPSRAGLQTDIAREMFDLAYQSLCQVLHSHGWGNDDPAADERLFPS